MALVTNSASLNVDFLRINSPIKAPTNPEANDGNERLNAAIKKAEIAPPINEPMVLIVIGSVTIFLFDYLPNYAI